MMDKLGMMSYFCQHWWWWWWCWQCWCDDSDDADNVGDDADNDDSDDAGSDDGDDVDNVGDDAGSVVGDDADNDVGGNADWFTFTVYSLPLTFEDYWLGCLCRWWCWQWWRWWCWKWWLWWWWWWWWWLYWPINVISFVISFFSRRTLLSRPTSLNPRRLVSWLPRRGVSKYRQAALHSWKEVFCAGQSVLKRQRKTLHLNRYKQTLFIGVEFTYRVARNFCDFSSDAQK